MNDLLVLPLSRGALALHLPALIALDAGIRAEYGDGYSPEVWGGAEFSKELPGKWNCSFVAVDAAALRGFIVASVKEASTLYVHRLAVGRAWRGMGLGVDLLRCAVAAGAQRGCRRAALSVNPANTVALSFYACLGFEDDPHATACGNRILKAEIARLRL